MQSFCMTLKNERWASTNEAHEREKFHKVCLCNRAFNTYSFGAHSVPRNTDVEDTEMIKRDMSLTLMELAF